MEFYYESDYSGIVLLPTIVISFGSEKVHRGIIIGWLFWSFCIYF